MLEKLVAFLNEYLGCSIEVPVDTEDITDVTETQDENTIVYSYTYKSKKSEHKKKLNHAVLTLIAVGVLFVAFAISCLLEYFGVL